VLVHGGGDKAFDGWAKLWASSGYAAIAMDLSGKGPDGKRLADGGPDQSDVTKFRTDEAATDQWTYHSVAAVIRAHSLLRSFPEVDAQRTAVTGISWGG
jgi:cephalosporin-C deacetylase-like acetyl esterase